MVGAECVPTKTLPSVKEIVSGSIGLSGSISVVESELRDLKIPSSNPVNHTMLIRDSAGPETRQGVFQGFRFPNPIIVASDSIPDQLVDTPDHLPVRS